MTTKTAGWLPLLVATTVMAGACGSPATGNRTSTSRTANPTPTIASQATTCSSTNPCLALVTLRGSNQISVRDITDISNPKTVSTFNHAAPRFISRTEVSYVGENSLIRMPLGGSPRVVVATPNLTIRHFAWSPDGSTVVYITESGSSADVHQLRPSGDRVLGSLPAGGAGGCETIANCTLPNTLDYQLSYSPDGTTISLVVNMFNVVVFRVWSSDGKLLRSSDAKGATMSAWSGRALYFRDAKGVQVWRDGADSTFLPGVAWIRPKSSPGGGQIVYTARDASGWGHVYVVDTTTGNVRELKTGRTEPTFLTSRYLWYEGERACVPADGCGPQPPFHPLNGKTYIYDLQDATETESIITGIEDVWPHPA